MPTSLVTAARASSAASVRLPALARPARDLRRQPRDRLAREHQHLKNGVTSASRCSTSRSTTRSTSPSTRLPHGLARLPDRLRAAAAPHAQGGRVRHAQHARPRQEAPRPLPARLDLGGVRRPARPPAAGDLLGQREPDRAARRLRRGEALRRGALDGLPAPAGRGHRDRPHLQHVRPANAPERRARHPAFLGQALADRPVTVFGDGSQTQLLLRGRPRPRARAARRVRGPRAGEHRQPERDVAARDGEADHRADRVALRGRVRGAAGGRPPGAPARHRAGARPARLGAGGGRARGIRRTIEHYTKILGEPASR